MNKKIITSLFILICFISAKAQDKNDTAKHNDHSMIIGGNETGGDTSLLNYSSPHEYIIGSIVFDPPPSMDVTLLAATTGLITGQKIRIPGDDISKAISTLWKQGYFEDVQVQATRAQDNFVNIIFKVTNKPVLSKVNFKGVTKSEVDDIRKKINFVRGTPVTESNMERVKTNIKEYFVNKGYPDVKIDVKQTKDTTTRQNDVIVYFSINVGQKVKIGEINFYGSTIFSNGKLWRTMKDTKRKRWWDVFNSGKLIEDDFEKDKQKIIDKYKDRGYRDARIAKDSVYRISQTRWGVDIYIDEGRKYYFRSINFVGNAKYDSKLLGKVLGIKRGDIYNQSTLDSRLYNSAAGTDVSSLYMDDGYLFFHIEPVEVLVEGDSIDLEIRISEGKQATINKVTVVGNTKTNDRVIMRELRTRPGQLFRRSDILRSQRDLAQLGYFDPEKMQVNPTPNAANGTVDIEYVVEEKPSDQLELSGGFGAGRIIGTLGVSFNNFSAENMFKKGAWAPLPSGDGERLSLRAQSNGLYYRSGSFSFTEPWFGGKKPHSVSLSYYRTVITNGQTETIKDAENIKIPNTLYSGIKIDNVSIGFGTRMKKPDDYFQFYGELAYQYYALKNYTTFVFTDGYANDLHLRLVLSRNSVDQPLTDFPTSGSNITWTLQGTPPYSLIPGSATYNKDLSTFTDQQKYKWIESYKFKFTTSWFTRLLGKDRKHSLVLNTRIGFGILGAYNPALGTAPFGRFYLGGSGLTGFYSYDGREIIALRGYSDNTVFTSSSSLTNLGAAAIAKYTLEMRYPISLNPQALVYGLAFAEAGNSWDNVKDFNPFDVKRSVGVGFRIFLPMFGLLGLDYGWRLDDIPAYPNMQKGQFHFTIGMNLGEL